MVVSQGREEAKEIWTRKLVTSGEDGSIYPEYDSLLSEQQGYGEDTARDTYVTLYTVPTNKIFHLKDFMFTNNETFNLKVEIFDNTTQIFEVTVGAGQTFGAEGLKGCRFSTTVRMKTQGAARVSGVYTWVGGLLRDST